MVTFCNVVYALPSQRIDVLADRYDLPMTTKEQTRAARAKKSASKSRKKLRRTAVEKVVLPDTELPCSEKDFKLFTSLDKNKQGLQLILGNSLISRAPQNKTIVVQEPLRSLLKSRAKSNLQLILNN